MVRGEPVFGPSKLVDFELEMAFITTDANDLGEPIPIGESRRVYFWPDSNLMIGVPGIFKNGNTYP